MREQGLQLLLVKSISPVLILKLQESEIKSRTGEKILYLDFLHFINCFKRYPKEAVTESCCLWMFNGK